MNRAKYREQPHKWKQMSSALHIKTGAHINTNIIIAFFFGISGAFPLTTIKGNKTLNCI
jgi:hypothetical protein